MKVAVTDFKAHCTEYLRLLPQQGEILEVTKRGEVIALVQPVTKSGVATCWGGLRGTIRHIAADFDLPDGDDDWKAAQ